MSASLVGSEMCIRDSSNPQASNPQSAQSLAIGVREARGCGGTPGAGSCTAEAHHGGELCEDARLVVRCRREGLSGASR
eukprot:3405130-Alexandrium_andersonii.AAC.1